jgi:PIN domain nuclease of toxin-antitoxin system
LIAGVADTHAALWYLFGDARLSPVAKQFIEEAVQARRQIAVSAISVAEVVYLVEKGRLPRETYAALVQALADPLHVLTEAAFTVAIVDSMARVSFPRSRYARPHDRGYGCILRRSGHQPGQAYTFHGPEDDLVMASGARGI